jgi:hypothetical protein
MRQSLRSRLRAAASLDLSMKKIAKAVLARSGWELGRSADREAQALADLSAADRQIVARVAPYTMTGLERRKAAKARSSSASGRSPSPRRSCRRC